MPTPPVSKPAPTGALPRRLVAGTLGGVLVAAVAAGCARGDDRATPGPSGTTARAGALPPAELSDPGLVHVHGLGVDPADGTLYAATHSGLFEVPESGQARRIADRYQDTMGFTVAGPGVLLGSGHPDPREDDVRPPLLGLIESRDQGRTWQRLSLHGEADFHALQAAHGQVYGYDATSGTFMVSQDKRTWQRRARLPLRHFVVDPSDPQVVLATTGRGLVRSADGGRTFTPVAGAPVLVVLAWAPDGSLYGLDPAGALQHSSDGGATWTGRGDIGGEPEALAVHQGAGAPVLYAAAADRGIVVSDDGGRTFRVRYRQQPGAAGP